MKLEDIARNALANALKTVIDAEAGTATARFQNTAQTQTFATCNLLDPSFGAATGGQISINGTPVDSTATAGVTTRCGFYDGATTPNLIFTLGVNDAGTPDMLISNTQLDTNDKVEIQQLNITVPASAVVT